MIRYPNINPIAISIGPLHIHWYGVMYLLGFAAAWWLARQRAARPGSSWSAVDVDDFLFYGMLGVIIGGRVGYVLFYGMPLWRGDWLYPLKIWEGGMSFHGGMLGVLAAAWVFARQRGRHVFDVYDFAAPLPGIGLFFGRVGNFIMASSGAAPRTCPGRCWCPIRTAARRWRVTHRSCMKRCWKAWCCSRSCGGSLVNRGHATRRRRCS
jgi:prolipoprotein diacylglyceryl transferase